VADSSSRRQVLCIEDEPETVELIRLILERRGFTVVEASSGAAGLRALRGSRPDLILLDLMTPDIDGWDVYQRIKSDSSTSGIPVIVVTARAQNIDRVIGRQIAKVDDYIVKPFSPKRLLDGVERVLQERHPAG
jgi:two-component system response regulator VicR